MRVRVGSEEKVARVASPLAEHVPMVWMLPGLLRRRRISAAQFVLMLRRVGHELSLSQAYRLLRYPPQRYDAELLAAICHALDCEIGELLRYEAETAEAPPLPPAFQVPGSE